MPRISPCHKSQVRDERYQKHYANYEVFFFVNNLPKSCSLVSGESTRKIKGCRVGRKQTGQPRFVCQNVDIVDSAILSLLAPPLSYAYQTPSNLLLLLSAEILLQDGRVRVGDQGL